MSRASGGSGAVCATAGASHSPAAGGVVPEASGIPGNLRQGREEDALPGAGGRLDHDQRTRSVRDTCKQRRTGAQANGRGDHDQIMRRLTGMSKRSAGFMSELRGLAGSARYSHPFRVRTADDGADAFAS